MQPLARRSYTGLINGLYHSLLSSVYMLNYNRYIYVAAQPVADLHARACNHLSTVYLQQPVSQPIPVLSISLTFLFFFFSRREF